MAQSKSFFGLRKGSTKSLTFQVLNGKQITKDRVFNVKNPQTLAQMQQRALMATAVSAYSRMKAICDHSFEGVEIGTKTMSEFIRSNVKLLSANMPDINVAEYKSGQFVLNPYLISKGTLIAPKTSYSNGKFIVNTGLNGTQTNPGTWGKLAEAMGIKVGGMLTFVVQGNGDCYWLRIKFNNELWSSNIHLGESVINELKSVNAIEGNTMEFDGWLTMPTIEGGVEKPITFELELADDEAATAIISEKAEGIWKRSTAYLQGNFIYKYEAAFSTYPINTTLLLNGGKMKTNVITK